jgi:hypothetical protein
MARTAPSGRSADGAALAAGRAAGEPVRAERQDGPGPAVDAAAPAPGLTGLSLPRPAPSVRRSATGADPLGGATIPAEVLTALRRRQGGGQPLPETVAAPAGETLGHDLSGVRVHTDAEADGIARSVQSVAFSFGTDIYFTAGSYRPQESGGQQLLGHELAHVAQAETGSGGVIGRADDPAEAAADRAATGVVAALRRPGTLRRRGSSGGEPPRPSAGCWTTPA